MTWAMIIQEALNQLQQYHNTYKSFILSPAFSGFLSISGFIFAMHSFVITKMKEGVYDSTSYKNKLQIAANKHGKNVPRYGTLKALHELLMQCVYLCLAAALSQLVLGYIEVLWVGALILIFVAIGMLFKAICAMKENMNYLFEELDKEIIRPERPG
ncbi:MAG: hypothetical protein A2283_19040 [Lentisphaerae bacterium RIFOXYA12_FULL_48_11]|nr:MAG: hypothetical protein A2283_19040 [Lentisphaerae bacterium RIFOXYA12_FULL_48_11]